MVADDRCRGTRVDGQRCNAKAAVGGFCGRHKAQIDKPADWQIATVEEIERRKQFSLMRLRELEVSEQEARLVDVSVTRAETTIVIGYIADNWSTFTARTAHEIAAALGGIDVGLVAAVLERFIRIEMKRVAGGL